MRVVVTARPRGRFENCGLYRTNPPIVAVASGQRLRVERADRVHTTEGPRMILDLTQDDARMLRELLQNYLPDLKREVARTEVKTLRHELVLRQELCERLLDKLATAPV